MKKIVKKSPFKSGPVGQTDQEKKSSTTTVVKGARPGYGAIVSQSNTSKSAGSKLTNATPATSAPAVQKTKTIEVPNRGSSEFNKVYAGAKEGATFIFKGKKYLKKTSKTGATTKVKVPVTETTPTPTPTPKADNAPDDNSNNSGTTDIEETTKQGTTALDVRGDNRKIKVATRESANAAKNIIKFEEKAKKATNDKKRAKFEAKAAGNRTKLQYNQEVLGHAEEAGRQGSTGNRMVTTSKDISNARITAQNKGLIEGSNSQSSSNNGFVAPKEAVPTDSGLIKKKEDSPAAMVKSSVLKMFKPGSFKMGGFGSKSKK